MIRLLSNKLKQYVDLLLETQMRRKWQLNTVGNGRNMGARIPQGIDKRCPNLLNVRAKNDKA